MSQRRLMRELRKEMLILQAEQLRLVLREDLRAISPGSVLAPDSSSAAEGGWLETLMSLLGAVLPPRWGRWLNIGLSAWRIRRRASAMRESGEV